MKENNSQLLENEAKMQYRVNLLFNFFVTGNTPNTYGLLYCTVFNIAVIRILIRFNGPGSSQTSVMRIRFRIHPFLLSYMKFVITFYYFWIHLTYCIHIFQFTKARLKFNSFIRFFQYVHIWIRICIPNTDPDIQKSNEYRYGSKYIDKYQALLHCN